MLVKGRKTDRGTLTRKSTLGPELRIEDTWQPGELQRIAGASFSAIHMASAGYWQMGDLTRENYEPSGGGT